jgi:hypothetical protein
VLQVYDQAFFTAQQLSQIGRGIRMIGLSLIEMFY